MGVRGSGRRRKPTAMKRIQGTLRPSRVNKREPKPGKGEPESPIQLQEVAARHWQRLIRILRGMDVLTCADGDALAAYCTALATWEAATADVAKEGIVYKNGKANPVVRIQFEALKLMKSLEVEFGLTPASRSRVSVVHPPGDENDLLANVTRSDEIVE